MHIHSIAAAATAARGDVAANAQLRTAFGRFIERVGSLRRPPALTAFTSPALFRELVARIERARLAPRTSLGTSSRRAKPARWCGASPLERKRAAWRERRRASR